MIKVLKVDGCNKSVGFDIEGNQLEKDCQYLWRHYDDWGVGLWDGNGFIVWETGVVGGKTKEWELSLDCIPCDMSFTKLTMEMARKDKL